MSCVIAQGVDLKDLTEKAICNHKQFFWHWFSNFLLVNCIVLGYSSLHISSNIRYLKLKGMPNINKCELDRDIFALCFWLAQNYMKICLRNITSVKLKKKSVQEELNMTVFCNKVELSWILFSTYLDSFL